MSESYIEVELDQQPIELYKLLKIADLVSGGGEAKVVISEGYVLLNGEVEYRKRKKVYHEDVIEFNGETVQLIINESQHEDNQAEQHEGSPHNDVFKAYNPPKNSTKSNAKNNSEVVEEVKQPKKRKPISF